MDLQLQEEKKKHQHLGAFSDSAVPERAMKDKRTCTHMQRARRKMPLNVHILVTHCSKQDLSSSPQKKYLTHKKRICGVDRHQRRNTPNLLFVERRAERLNHESGALDGPGRAGGEGLGREMMSHARSSRSPDADKVALRGKSQTRGRQIVPLSPFCPPFMCSNREEKDYRPGAMQTFISEAAYFTFMSLNHAGSIWVSSSSGMTSVKM